VVRDILNPRQQALGLRLEYPSLVVIAGEFFYRLQRVEEINHDELGFAIVILSKDTATLVAFESSIYFADFVTRSWRAAMAMLRSSASRIFTVSVAMIFP
jgi:hypothetical protein